MKISIYMYRVFSLCLILLTFSACEKELTELNQNPNGIDPATANPNMIMPIVLGGAAQNYLGLGYGNIAGVVQHTQKDGWFDGHNQYNWNAQDWTGWFGLLRNNKLMYERAVELDWEFHQGVALTMKSFIFGAITDLWGDAPYSDALQGDEGSLRFEYPVFDSQETIYNGIIEDLKAAAALFANADNTGINSSNDLYYNGDIKNWERFANSLLLRYYMRISGKNPSLAQSGIEAIYQTGNYLQSADQDATLPYTGQGSDVWPTEYSGDSGSNFRRLKPCQTLIDQLTSTADPRLEVWIDPVHCQWVEDESLTDEVDPFIRKNGVIMEGIAAMEDVEYIDAIAQGDIFTRRYNPNLTAASLNDAVYVGLPAGLQQPSSYNLNPTPGQSVENQHVSQLSEMYREGGGDLLRARLISAAEVHFILAEAALNGWSVGDAAAHYQNGVKASLETWEVGDQYDDFIANVSFDGTLEQIIQQKWVASWTAATEAWFDFRRTGLPALTAGPAAAQPVLPVRFNYGTDELNNNETNALEAVSRLEITDYSGARGKDSQWSKPWLLQGTGKPW
ncbi:SusD/RagB family nutrient-binding outer membrane lipoprotein [Flavilitoribacter nigricans]|uniref:SusD/RagB family nutrient-binding outer membrane lipoprotein n=1 Tax=Flavilitoribacter nigricans (strain ATCC 23147 / DSM 23189 / NBRC 102662 / NCIMB 1420 / SS-2) TaxID=1122177 RepID=A0A2D0NAA5_FLAN2|nr:SusD/RagB family nutrient-binding outer membrane lipoprotein [Flavilitoribacter nigricans]PHN05451.1 SusD/RagB family nutrient-binding outer membrane lipoprotein [Flavilitoribacter nigricans DSM 23189 = NBRC 102662]